MKISEKEINEAMDNEFDGIEDCVLVEEILELRKKIKGLEELNNALKIHKFQSEKWFKHLEEEGIYHVDLPFVPESE